MNSRKLKRVKSKVTGDKVHIRYLFLFFFFWTGGKRAGVHEDIFHEISDFNLSFKPEYHRSNTHILLKRTHILLYKKHIDFKAPNARHQSHNLRNGNVVF